LGTPRRSVSTRRAPSPEIFESKLHRPLVRPAIVARTALVDRLLDAAHAPVVSIVGPPGYGKTTLLSQWAERKGARVAWLSIDERDNDPELLMTYAVEAIDRVEPLPPELRSTRARRDVVAASAIPRLARAMAAAGEPVTLALDHVELLQNTECLDAIAELALHLPAGSQLALATRGDPPVPVARLRAGGDIVEVGVDELAMNACEARALLEGAGAKLSDAVVQEVFERTEGWPAGLYLAALALQASGAEGGVGPSFSGDDRLMADYLRSELLAHLNAREVTFLTRSAVLDRMCGPLCDAVLDAPRSANTLEELERSNLLLVPLDRRRQWYRYHHLFRDLLRAELSRREPALVPELHRRAATWFEANGLPDMAIEHAQAAGDADQVARLVAALAQPTFASGRVDTVLRWIEWFDEHDLVEAHPAVAAYGATIYADLGRPLDAERWAELASRGRADEVLADGSTMRGLLAFLRMRIGAESAEDLRRDAEIGLAELSPASRLRPAMLIALGWASVLEGAFDDADPVLAHAVDAALHIGGMPGASLGLAARALVAIERDDWAEAEALSARALDIVREQDLEDYPLSGLAFVLCARIALRRGELEATLGHIASVVRLRPRFSYVQAHISALTLIELARVYVALSDTGGARAVLREVNDILRVRPALGFLPVRAAELQAKLEAMQNVTVGASSLTTAELRLVPHLATHLTFPEIGTRLHISRHTVKTQAISIYQKLGVSSRSEAIERMRDIGLLSA
jgi:LuxR family transcriptional regulator, maltose regulon positive regulatory protein